MYQPINSRNLAAKHRRERAMQRQLMLVFTFYSLQVDFQRPRMTWVYVELHTPSPSTL